MASGDTLFEIQPQDNAGPSTNFATQDLVLDASTPPTLIPVLDFDGAADEHADFKVQVPSHYDGGGFTFSYKYAMDSTDGNIVEIEFRSVKIADTTVITGDLGIDAATAAAVQDDPSTTANDFNYSGTANLSHANAGSPSAGDYLCLRFTRDISAATNADDLQLASILVTET